MFILSTVLLNTRPKVSIEVTYHTCIKFGKFRPSIFTCSILSLNLRRFGFQIGLEKEISIMQDFITVLIIRVANSKIAVT